MIALYLRVSRADGEGESGSVANQRLLLTAFARQLLACGELAADEVVEFVDDGCTGMNMMRQGLQEMLALCYAGLVSAVIVRDFSRLARDYVDLGMLVEHTLPALGVRLISLGERFDSWRVGGDLDLPQSADVVGAVGGFGAGGFASVGGAADADLLRGIVGIANSYYSRDISLRVRTSLAASWRQGVHVQAFAPFGYLYDPRSRGHLQPDPVAGSYVVRLFDMAAGGMRPAEIARELEAHGIPTPAAYARKAGIYGKQGCYAGAETPWNARKVRYLLRREVYAGVHIGGLTRQLGIGRGSARRETPPSARIRVEDAHEPLVPRPLFDAAQKVIGRRSHEAPRKQTCAVAAPR